MARLIDYHTNCNCGGDVHVTGDLNEEGYLNVETGTTGGRCGQTADAGAFLGNAMTSVGLVAAVDRGQLIGVGDPTDSPDDPMARHLELVEATAWLAEQLDTDTLDVDEARRRFRLPAVAESDDVNDAPPAPAEATAAATGPARPRPGRRGGG